MMKCKGCSLDHSPMMRCEVARRLLSTTTEAVSTTVEPAPVVDKPRHGKYADTEKRRAYQREWVALKRERGRNAASNIAPARAFCLCPSCGSDRLKRLTEPDEAGMVTVCDACGLIFGTPAQHDANVLAARARRAPSSTGGDS